MRGLTDFVGRPPAAAPPKGLAFEIDDLNRVTKWASFYDFRISVRLDHGVEDEEYEEVIEFQSGAGSLSRLIMWRNQQAVFIQPLVGRKTRYESVQQALRGILIEPNIVLTDIVADSWPAA